MTIREFPPGVQAPSAGIYEQCNVFGAPTGIHVTLPEGTALPVAPRGFTWRIVEEAGDSPDQNGTTDGRLAGAADQWSA